MFLSSIRQLWALLAYRALLWLMMLSSTCLDSATFRLHLLTIYMFHYIILSITLCGLGVWPPSAMLAQSSVSSFHITVVEILVAACLRQSLFLALLEISTLTFTVRHTLSEFNFLHLPQLPDAHLYEESCPAGSVQFQLFPSPLRPSWSTPSVSDFDAFLETSTSSSSL